MSLSSLAHFSYFFATEINSLTKKKVDTRVEKKLNQ